MSGGLDSLESLDPKRPIKKWILCVSVDKTGDFTDWLRDEVSRYEFIQAWEVWDKTELLLQLEKAPEVLEIFFYRAWSELAQHFRSEDLELVSFELDRECNWRADDPATMIFYQGGSKRNSDLVFDIIIRNRGTIDALLVGGQVTNANYWHKMHGAPAEGLLFPKITYKMSIHSGREGTYSQKFDPPLIVPAGKHERFKLCLTDTDYAWYGDVSMTLSFGSKMLRLPWIRMQT